MKIQQDGSLAFYPRRAAVIFMAVFFVVIWAMLFSTLSQANRGIFFLIILGIATLGVFKQAFWPAPVCVLYPERLEWYKPGFLTATKQSLLWAELEGIFLKEEWVKSGKNSRLVEVLYFVCKTPSSDGKPRSCRYYHTLSKADKQRLMDEFSARGLAQLPTQTDNSVPKFIKNIWSKY